MRAYVYIEFKRGRSAKDIHAQLIASGVPGVPDSTTVWRWHTAYQNGKESFRDDPRSGRPSSARTDAKVQLIQQAVSDYPNQSLRCLSDQFDISKDSVGRILKNDLHMRKVCAQWVPHALSEQNKLARVQCAQSLVNILDNNSMEDCLRFWAVEDESWILFNDLPPKQQNMAWIPRGAPRPTVVRPKLTKQKTMLVLAFTGDGKVCMRAMSPGECLNSEGYVNFITECGNKWRSLRTTPTTLTKCWWQHDNARCHAAAHTQEFLARRHVYVIRQSAYSPDFNMCDRWLFKYVKNHLRQFQFADKQSLLEEALRCFRAIGRDRFVKEFQHLYDHCKAVINANGDYISC